MPSKKGFDIVIEGDPFESAVHRHTQKGAQELQEALNIQGRPCLVRCNTCGMTTRWERAPDAEKTEAKPAHKHTTEEIDALRTRIQAELARREEAEFFAALKRIGRTVEAREKIRIATAVEAICQYAIEDNIDDDEEIRKAADACKVPVQVIEFRISELREEARRVSPETIEVRAAALAPALRQGLEDAAKAHQAGEVAVDRPQGAGTEEGAQGEAPSGGSVTRIH